MNAGRARILGVATRLFADRGFDGASTRDIAAEAGVNMAMIAYYFGSKEGLFRAVASEMAHSITGGLEELQRGSEPPWTRMQAMAEFYTESLLADSFARARILLRESFGPHRPGLQEYLSGLLRPHREAFMAVAAAVVEAEGGVGEMRGTALVAAVLGPAIALGLVPGLLTGEEQGGKSDERWGLEVFRSALGLVEPGGAREDREGEGVRPRTNRVEESMPTFARASTVDDEGFGIGLID